MSRIYWDFTSGFICLQWQLFVHSAAFVHKTEERVPSRLPGMDWPDNLITKCLESDRAENVLGRFLIIKKLIGTLALSLLFAAHANAASMSVTGPTDATVGDSFQIQIWGDFSGEGLIAGGITFFWADALVQLDYVQLELGTIPWCHWVCPAVTSNSVAIAWGEFLVNLIDPGVPPPTLMATLGFTAVDAAASEALAFFFMENNSDLTSGWWGAGFSPIDVPSFGTFSMEISDVPLPAAVWFMIGGLGALLGFRRK